MHNHKSVFKKRNNQCAFTLLEMLVVLCVIQVMTSVLFLVVQPLMEHYRIQLFLKQLQTDLFYTQQIAMSRGQGGTFSFNNENATYSVVQRQEVLFEKSYDEQIFVSSVSGLNSIRYNQRGNISQGRTYIIRSGDTAYRLVFQLGRGRFYVEEL
ncbi:competence type IV pilus minor pilin ComGD [Metabacillus iocasae]|uniref:Competence protein ComGD n=1 Tax=Priestia iocasae TaxID=2291674 RepID=A0ABS2QQ19_9BACI|nr:competence type IV pilus minor pilin ComGD [Metabacillus iocasae]MBM7701548.1 competence protein ComGD [Metabacillus iocasae]